MEKGRIVYFFAIRYLPVALYEERQKPMKNLILIILFSLGLEVSAGEYNLYIEYCRDKHPENCEEYKSEKAVRLLEKKGFHIVTEYETPLRIVIQLHNGCSFFEICEPQMYIEKAIIRIQDPKTFQTYIEEGVFRHVYPRTSKVLMEEVIEKLHYH